ncbi:phosphoribosylglycinamide formyltransferase [Phaeovibrio sulfidiphilus]|uniref:Phosphoribosylglycinamide formyltransferase n=1 Tax=Phaeovibrio sulfidiphilus TaxID=1220600 RepID=A0A8J6YJF7_9PROT|nr:phosphoribosylglycinamide formyltransferase [Phaeovibrio sulfidiphilus]MBE1237461.1 phosphoribosylglycinamide formyltransferase [Phaeovibrio sulfidiphilus]
MTNPQKKRVAILISGRGSNMEALANAAMDPGYPARIVLVVSNDPEAPGLEIASSLGIQTAVVDHRLHPTKTSFENTLQACLEEAETEIVCLAGFMRILSAEFVNRWHNRLLNIHPSLLPSFPGLDTHKRAIEAGVLFHGCTVHLVRPVVDGGPILMQAVVPVRPTDTPETLGSRVLQLEHQLYSEALALVSEGRVQVVGEKVIMKGAVVPGAAVINPDISRFNPQTGTMRPDPARWAQKGSSHGTV